MNEINQTNEIMTRSMLIN